MGEFGIGQGIKRFEDGRLLRGGGRFHDDANVAGQTHAVIVRSIHAHARIRGIDTSAAQRAPGVVAVFTGADLAKEPLGTMQMTLKRKRPDGSPMWAPAHRGLTSERARYVGDPLALVRSRMKFDLVAWLREQESMRQCIEFAESLLSPAGLLFLRTADPINGGAWMLRDAASLPSGMRLLALRRRRSFAQAA